MALSVIILAAGQGTRMRSDMPKVLHAVGGHPMLAHVIQSAEKLNPDCVHIVHGHGGEHVKSALTDYTVTWVKQAQQLGTGHAVKQALPAIRDDHHVLVLYGDVPLIQASTLSALYDLAQRYDVALLTVSLNQPKGYGRIVRNTGGNVERIVEEKDASDEIKKITEVNTGILIAKADKLKAWMNDLNNNNAQGEYYLTDIIEMAVNGGLSVEAHCITDDVTEVMGVNDKLQLAVVERAFQQRKTQELMRQGATLADPSRVDIRGDVKIGRDVFIDVNAVLEGDISLGDRVEIGPNVYLKDVYIGDDVTIKPNSVLEEARVGAKSRIGPFARIRPGTELADAVHVGNFVETKNAKVASGSKLNHLSYIGDAVVGQNVNVGAGTITCNYDGVNKFVTEIDDNAFIGSNSQLVAPVKIGEGATIGAGSTITKDAPAGELTLARTKQKTIHGWHRPVKKK